MATNEASSTARPPGSRRVLFVDDDVPFLETVRELMSVLSEGNWEVLAAETPSRAFTLMQEQAVDLVVVDVQMGVMDGIQMLSLLNRGHPNVQKVVLTGFANEKYRAACLSNGAELFLEKPTNPTGWQSLYGVLNELIKTRPEEGFRGVLRRVGLQDVIQMECLARSSSVLEVSHANIAGKIYIDTGQVVHAQTNAATGEEAFNQLLSLTGGQFNLRPFAEPALRSISGQWEFLLMEAARKSDELKETTANAPPKPEAETLALNPAALSPEALQAEVARLSGKLSYATPAAPMNLAPIEVVPVLAASVASRPRVDEMLICSPTGEVLYEWQCHNTGVWVNFFEFLSQRAQRLTQVLPLGEFDRLEVESGGARAVLMISQERGILVKSRREALQR